MNFSSWHPAVKVTAFVILGIIIVAAMYFGVIDKEVVETVIKTKG